MIPFTILDAEQRSPEWHAARLGRLTSTGAEDFLATIKSGAPAASREKILTRLVLERLTGRSQESPYVSAAMQQGIDREADAFALYEAQTGRILHRTGFLSCSDLMAGASLDGCEFGDNGAIVRIAEIKCPEDHTHYRYLRTGKIPHGYLCQIRHALWITGAAECDWFSYNPHFPEAQQIALVTVKAADLNLAEYDQKARAFLAEVDAEYRSVLGWKVVA